MSHGSLHFHNKGRPWTKKLGYSVAELIEGCPTLPRWGFSAHTTNTILLAAFLGQAIVLRGHQQELRDGVELLDQLARFINSLGPVSWSNLTDLSRMNYLLANGRPRFEGEAARAKTDSPLAQRSGDPCRGRSVRLCLGELAGLRGRWSASQTASK